MKNLQKLFFIYLDKTDDGRIYYVGKGLKDRVQQKKRNKKHKAISQKFGFNREIVFETSDENEAFAKEIELINFHQTFTTDWSHQTIVCNFTLGGEGVSGSTHVCPEELKIKLREMYKGKKLSEEHRLKVVAALTGRKHPPRSEEYRENLSASQKGVPGRHTTPHTEETKKKLAEKAHGRKVNDAQRLEIKELYADGFSQGELAEKFGIDKSQISRIINNKTTIEARAAVKTGRKGKRKLSTEQAQEIRNLYMTKKYTHKELALKYEVNTKSIIRILNNDVETNISMQEEGQVVS